ncbi:MAG: hypothetical protein KAR19_08805 [Bacteroidales bacterium]|nr:hypothetical protein [Bacteroidales bacterium]
MDIRSVTIKELTDFISADAYSRMEVVPITPERVRSQVQNPHAKPDDDALWNVASNDGRVIGFIGSLPAYDVHNKRRMGWNSCWWIDPERGRELALPLFYKFLSYWDQQVAFADMTPHTYAIINQLGFCHTRAEMLVQSYIRLSGKRILRKTGIAGKVLYPAIITVAFLINSIQQIRMSLITRLDQHLKLEVREHIDDEIYDFIRLHQENDFLQRSQDDFKWIEENPWLVKRSDETEILKNKYPFSYQVLDFGWEWLIAKRGGVITSVMLTSRRDGDLKLLYYFGDQVVDSLRVLKNKIFRDKRIQSVILGHPEMVACRREMRAISLYNRLRTRYVGVSKKILDTFPEDMVIQLGDGDAVFT